MRMSQHIAERAYKKLGMTVLYDKKARRLHVLEDTAATIWQLLICGLDPVEISRRSAQEYDCLDSTLSILEDVNEFVGNLQKHNLIEAENGVNYIDIHTALSNGLDERKKETKLLDIMAHAQIPYTVTWELTHFCNLTCAHCYCPTTAENVWSVSRINDTLDILKEMGTIDIQANRRRMYGTSIF